MQDARGEWVWLARAGFRVDLCHPVVTPNGHPVVRSEERVEAHPVAGDFERVHLASTGSNELYIEVARFPGRSPEDEYRDHHPYLVERFGSAAVTALDETTFGGRRAWTYSFRWDDRERTVLLLDVSGDTYRVIHDPSSELNRQVLETLTVSS